jgi:transposase
MPQKAGDRVKLDRRDAVPLGRLWRSGALTPVSGPTGEADALRALTRAREEARPDLKATTCRLKACWLRQDSRDTGAATWGPAHLRWRAAVVCLTPAPHMVFQAQCRAVTAPTARLARLAQARPDQGNAWLVSPVVAALQARRGVQCTVAMTPVVAWGDQTRVETPRHLMTGMGLIPSAYTGGARRRPGARTNAGHTQARRALVKGA